MLVKIIRILVVIFLLIFALLIVAPFAIDVTNLKSHLEQKISQKLNADFTIKGKVEINFLPLPSISLADITISKLALEDQYSSDINIHHLIIKPSIFSLFGKKIEISELIFEGPNIKNKYSAETKFVDKTKVEEIQKVVNETNKKSLLNQIFDFKKIDESTFNFENIKSIEVDNGSFSKQNIDNTTVVEFTKINFSIKNNLKKQIFTIKGNFLSDEEPTGFILVANATNKKESSLIVQSSIINLSLSGKFLNSNISDLIKSNFNGKIDLEIVDLKAFLHKYASKNNLLYRKINGTRPIKIGANITSQSGNIKVDNITIDSQSVSGGGKIEANFTKQKPTISADFDLEKLDIDNLWFSGALTNSPNVIKLENEIIQKFLGNQQIILDDKNKTYILPDNLAQPTNPDSIDLDLSAKIKIKTAKYNGNELKNVNIDIATSNNSLLLRSLSSEIPGNGSLQINGSLDNKNEIPQFIGKVKIIGQDLQKSLAWFGIELKNIKPKILNNYTLNADLLMLPSFNVFQNFNLAINGGENLVTGDLEIDDSSGISNLIANLRINYLDYDHYFLNTDTSQYLSRGSLLKKLLWLNTIDSNREISFKIDQVIYQGNSFDNQSFKVKFGQGYIKISNLNFSAPHLNFKGSIEADISNKTPKLNIDLTSDSFQYKNSDRELLGDLFFNLPAIDEFSGKINLNFKDLTLDSWNAQDVKISGKITGGVVSFDNFKLNTLSGKLKYDGEVILKNDKTINGSLELVGIDCGYILSTLMNIENIGGISNLSAIVNSTANNKAEFLKNLNASGQFIGSNIMVRGFGIYDLAVKMAQPEKYITELNNLVAILYNPFTSSTFKDLSGAFAIKKGSQDQLSIKVSSLGINGVISGEFDIVEKNIKSNANLIFISGTRQSQVPINIAINFSGKAGEIIKNNNLTQAEQYLQQRKAPIQSKN